MSDSKETKNNLGDITILEKQVVRTAHLIPVDVFCSITIGNSEAETAQTAVGISGRVIGWEESKVVIYKIQDGEEELTSRTGRIPVRGTVYIDGQRFRGNANQRGFPEAVLDTDFESQETQGSEFVTARNGLHYPFNPITDRIVNMTKKPNKRF